MCNVEYQSRLQFYKTCLKQILYSIIICILKRYEDTNVISILDCGSSLSVANGTVQIYKTQTFFGDNTTVSCNEGFRLNGSSDNKVVSEVITCQSDGAWRPAKGCVPKGKLNVAFVGVV